MYFTLCCRAWILETEKKSQQCLSAALEAPSCCTGAFMYSHVDLGIHLVQPGIKDLLWFWDIVSIWKVWCGLIPFGSVWQYTDQSFLIGISKCCSEGKMEKLRNMQFWLIPVHCPYKSLQFDAESSPQSIQPSPPEGSRSCRIHLKQSQKIPHQQPSISIGS